MIDHMSLAAERANLADYAYGILRDRLVMLDIPPGAPINETALAAELDLGRTPLREALKRLQTDHLVQFYARRGTFATPADLAELRSLTEMRVILEPAATRKAAQTASMRQRQELHRLAGDISGLMDSDPDARTLIEHDLSVHRAIYNAVDNEHMRETLFRLGNLATRLWWSVIQDVPSVADHIAGHQSLLDAVARGDAERSAELAREHVTEFHRKLQGAVIGSADMTAPEELHSEIH